MEVKDKIIRAYKLLLSRDIHLIMADANERSITHHFAVYLQEEFPEYNVDCEYNRTGELPKRIMSFKKKIDSDDLNAVTVYPDIIVHHRGTNENNIVIEVKKTSNNNNDDLEKLNAYKSELGYVNAFYIRIPIGKDFETFNQDNISEYVMEIK